METLLPTCDVSSSSGGNHHLQLRQLSVRLLQAAELQVGVEEVGDLDHDSGPVDRVEAHEAVGSDQVLVGEQTAQRLIDVV